MSRDIALFVDGTTNDQFDRNPTNILKMHRLTSPEVTSLYIRGLGNEFDNPGLEGILGRVFGGAFGAGADDKMDDAYTVLSAAWQPGDRIFIFAFSRGAAIARMLAMRIYRLGLNGLRPDIELLGCFDTVASFGIPGNSWNLFKDFHIAPNVKQARHAIALDENRIMFPLTQMNRRDGVEEVWFRGDHSDIGGGHDRSGLSDITLRWMLMEAEALGLQLNSDWLWGLNMEPSQEPYVNTNYRLTEPRIPGILVDDEFHGGNATIYY